MWRDLADIVKTRLGTLIVTKTKEEGEVRREEFKRRRGVDDSQLASMLICGVADAVGHAVQTHVDAGLDGLIFNMPAGSTPDDVELAGRTLAERFGT